MSTPTTDLNTLGKFKVIDTLAKPFKTHHSSTMYGVGEDTAVLEGESFYTLVSTALFLEGIHFDLTYCPLKHIGYKAVVANIANITAMNGVTEQIAVSMAISSKFSVETLQEMYQGIHQACNRYHIDLVGGDTTSSTTGLVISITAIGKVAKEKLCLRKGAKPHELVCVTGNLGAAYVGLQVLMREKKIFEVDPTLQPKLAPYQYVIERQLKPEARTDIVGLLHQTGILPTRMMNISDGLASELLHLGQASAMGITIHEDKLPIHAQTYQTAEELKLSPTLCALYGGEDYELLFTIAQANFPKLSENIDIHPIGYMTEASQGVNLIRTNGEAIDITTQGW